MDEIYRMPVQDLTNQQLREGILELLSLQRYGPIQLPQDKNREPSQTTAGFLVMVNRTRERLRIDYLQRFQDECRRRGISWVNQ